jgi:hypothetical protein
LPPLELAAVPSPVAQATNMPPAMSEYLYDEPDPIQPAGSVGMLFMNGPAI